MQKTQNESGRFGALKSGYALIAQVVVNQTTVIIRK
jgi:hypothetical protein